MLRDVSLLLGEEGGATRESARCVRRAVLDAAGRYRDATAQPAPHRDALQPKKKRVLLTIAFGQFDEETGTLSNDTTARRASALLVRDRVSDRAYVTLRLQDPVFFNAQTGELRSDHARFGQIDSDPIYLPNPVEDEAVFFTLQELVQLWGEPDRFDRVRESKGLLAAAILRQQMRLSLQEALTAGRPGEGFVVLRGGIRGDHYMLSAPRVEKSGDNLSLGAAQGYPIVIDRYDNPGLEGEPELRFEAQAGEIVVTTGSVTGKPEAGLTLWDVRVIDPILTDSTNEKPEHIFAPMRWGGDLLPGSELGEMSSAELGQLAKREDYAASVDVRQGRAELAYQIMRLTLKISAQAHTRAATAVACLLLIVLGGVLAIRMKGRMPLVVFFWSFLLALLTLLMVYAGQNMASKLDSDYLATGGVNWGQLIGLVVLWGGNLMTLVVIGREYCRIART